MRELLRSLASGRGLVLAAVVTVGVGLGPHVAVFGLFDRLILRPLPFHEPDRLVQIQLVVSRGGRNPQALLPFEYARALEERRDVFSGLAYVVGGQGRATRPVPGENPLLLSALTPNALEVLGIAPAVGRDFEEADLSDLLNKPILLTYETWTGRFHASDRVVGQSWTEGGVRYTIVGVLPRHFILPSSRLLERIDGVMPFRARSLAPGQLITAPFARLRSGVSVAHARDVARAALAGMHWEGGDEPKTSDPAARLDVRPLQSGIAALVEPYLWLLFGAVWLVFVVASVNLAVLLHTWQRLRETQTGIRLALGATLGHLMRSAFLETAVVCGVGALVAWVSYRVVEVELLAIVPPSLRGFAVSATDARVMGTTMLGALLAAVAVSAVPVRAALSVDVLTILHGRQAKARGRAAFPATLLAVEAALAFVVVAGAAATLPRYVAFLIGSPGFEPADRHVAYVDHDWPEAKGPEAKGTDRLAAILGAVSGLPGVDGAAVALAFDPLGGEPTDILRGALPHQDVRLLPVSAGYFDVAGMRLVAGRSFGDREVGDRAPVVVLNETAARELWPGRSLPEALGQDVLTGDLRRALVGVVADSSKYPGAPVAPTVFVPFTSIEGTRHGGDVPVLIRMSPGRIPDPALLKARLDRLFPPRRVRIESVEESLRPWLETPRLMAVLLGVAGLSAITLVATALYAVTHSEVKRRTAELRIRSLLGAAGWQVRLVVLRLVLLPVVIGTVGGGLVLAALLTRWQWLGGDDRLLVYGGAGLAIVAAAAAAAWLPASRIVTSPGGSILRSS